MSNGKVAIIDHVGMKGGNHYYGLMLLNAMHRKGYDTWFFSNFTAGQSPVQTPINIVKTYDFELSKSIKGLVNLLSGTWKAVRKCRKEGVKHVVFHLFDAGWINVFMLMVIRVFGLKVIAIAHDISSFDTEGSSENPTSRKLIYQRLANHIVVHNQFSYRVLTSILPPKTVERVHIVKHGGHTEVINKIPREQACELLGLDPKWNYVLFFGQIKKVKGLDLFLRGIKGIPENTRVVIAGKPWKDDFSTYEQIIEEEGIDNQVIRMIRYITEEERDALYSMANLLVLPYRKIYQSGVLLMAMSFGMPVLASDLPPNAEVVTDGQNGLLFAAGDANDLQQKLLAIANDEAKCAELGRNARATIDHDYSWDDIAEVYVGFTS